MARLSAMALRSGAPPLPARLSASAPLGLPSFTPRLLSTLSASLVRLEIASPLLLRHQRHDAHGEVVRLRQIHRREPNPAVPECQQEGGIARQPVELGDHQRGPGDLGQMRRLLQLRPVGVAAALYLGEAGDERSASLGGVCLDRLALGFQPKTAGALPCACRDLLVADDPNAPSDQDCVTFVAQGCTLGLGGSVAKSLQRLVFPSISSRSPRHRIGRA